MGWFVPQVLGVGYGFVGDALNGRMAFHLMLLLLVLKLFAVTTSYASGNAGGIFGPSLFLGAMLGGVVGTAAHHLFPLATATPGAYALVGMGAVFAGVVRTPMTSVLIIFEMTQDYAVIVPLMIANWSASSSPPSCSMSPSTRRWPCRTASICPAPGRGCSSISARSRRS